MSSRSGRRARSGPRARTPAQGRAQAKHPLVTACLITKDEEENLPGCLAAARRIADDVVVYDTGSTDATVAIAKQWGARVIEGYWDDDFARARNAALAECRGDWILWVDADETFECDDPAEVRQLLRATKDEIDAWSVPIWNLTGSGVGTGFTHHAARLFRRRRCEWVGRIHEQVTRTNTTMGITQAVLEIGRIRHTGYLDSVLVGRNKSDRNIRVAEREVAEADGWELGHSLASLGRSCMIAGRFHDAIRHCAEALDHTENPITRRLALRTCAEAHLGLQQYDDAERWIEQLAGSGASPNLVATFRARLAVAHGEHACALELLDQVAVEDDDDDGFSQTASMVAPLRAEVLAALGRHSDAADTLLGVLCGEGALDVHVGSVVEHLDRAGRPLCDLTAAIPLDKAELFLGQIRQLQVDVADRLLEGLWEHGRLQPLAVLATAAGTAGHLGVDRALVWSTRLRQAGVADACPLMALAHDPERTPAEQARAAGVGWRMFCDVALRDRFRVVYATADEVARTQILAEAVALYPDLAGRHADGRVMAASEPVTIVVPCLNHAEDTLRLLRSVAVHTAPDTYQVILADRGSTDAMTALSGDPGNLALVVLDAGWGAEVATALAVGVGAAAHEVVVFLDQRSEVLPGWLPPLVEKVHVLGEQARVVPQVIGRSGGPTAAGEVPGTAVCMPMVVGSADAARMFLRGETGTTKLPGQPTIPVVVEPAGCLRMAAEEPFMPGSEDFRQVLGVACR